MPFSSLPIAGLSLKLSFYFSFCYCFHCFSTFSQREEYIKGLRRHGISIDVMGTCGEKQIDFSLEQGETKFFQSYRFIFAMENSLCDDYITEKAFHAFYVNHIAGAIPVLYGAGNYADFFPDGSYIDIRKFHTIVDLVFFIKQMRDPEMKDYLRLFYQWQTNLNPIYKEGFEFFNNSDIYDQSVSLVPSWSRLCDKLWKNNNNTASNNVDNIKAHLGNCYAAVVPKY